MFMNPEKDGRIVRLGEPDQELIVIEDQLQEIEIEWKLIKILNNEEDILEG